MKILYDLFFQSIKSFAFINESAEKALARLGIITCRDLIFYKPISYNFINIEPKLNTVKHGDLIQIEVVLEDVLRPSLKKSPLKMQVSHQTGKITLIFFSKIHPFIFSKLRVGQKYTISGKVEIFNGNLQITHPEFIFNKKLTTSIIPVYPLTYGIVSKQLYSYVCEVINIIEYKLINNKEVTELYSKNNGIKEYLIELLKDIKLLHYIGTSKISDENWSKTIQNLSRRELYVNQALLAKVRKQEHRLRGRSFSSNNQTIALHPDYAAENPELILGSLGPGTSLNLSEMVPSYTRNLNDDDVSYLVLKKLGYSLTTGQEEVITEIKSDQASEFQMMRLLQGDVGSGKTLVALLTMLNTVKAGSQAVLMAPTDLLCIQHYQFFCNALENTDIKVGLLTGKISVKQRNIIREELQCGKINILIGTHALFQEKIEFHDLGYIVIDEQHRFGVEQRLELIKKASNPDVLVMTATPIPRSLALTMFGDMDVSQLKTKPRNRLPIITSIISNEKKSEVIKSLSKKIYDGEKIYWVCPLIDPTDHPEELDQTLDSSINCSNVAARFAELNQNYPGQVSMLHGKIKSEIKDQIMQEFKEGDTKILVATTVIEVGIDVPDSTLIIIENAEKFGLAQLHQLRGRVGRGSKQSYCMLMYEPTRLSALARERLKIMRASSDGFYIAEQDLILRGGGEILGTKQSGEPVFFFASLQKDLDILTKAHDLVKNIIIDEFIDFKIELFAKNSLEVIKSG